MKKVLVLGAGHVAMPLIRYLASDFAVTVAAKIIENASKLARNSKNIEVFYLDVEDREKLESFVRTNDLVVSLLPYRYHVDVAKLCLKHGKHLVTASYVSPEMRKLDHEARAKNLLFLNEIGLDPGIDHMSAMRIIDQVRSEGGRVVSFKSYCGGLPAPDSDDNPFHYKFSWSPLGVLLAVKNDAKYLEDGKVVEVPWQNLFLDIHTLKFDGIGELEAYPNRNSIQYIELYGLDNIKTMYRGTLRYPGHSKLWRKIEELGLISDERVFVPDGTYAGLVAKLVGADTQSELMRVVKEKVDDEEVVSKLSWLELFGTRKLPKNPVTPIEALVFILEEKLQYKEGEKDMTVLHHEFIAEYENGKKEKIESTLIDFGVVGMETSMARTVGLPAAIASKLILNGRFEGITGVQIPTLKGIYEPVLDELSKLGISFEERKVEL